MPQIYKHRVSSSLKYHFNSHFDHYLFQRPFLEAQSFPTFCLSFKTLESLIYIWGEHFACTAQSRTPPNGIFTNCRLLLIGLTHSSMQVKSWSICRSAPRIYKTMLSLWECRRGIMGNAWSKAATSSSY